MQTAKQDGAIVGARVRRIARPSVYQPLHPGDVEQAAGEGKGPEPPKRKSGPAATRGRWPRAGQIAQKLGAPSLGGWSVMKALISPHGTRSACCFAQLTQL